MVNETTTMISGSTDIIAIWLFAIIGVVLIAILIYIIVMFRRRYINKTVKVNIIYEDGNIKSLRLKNPEKSIKVFKKTYIFKSECLVRRRFGNEIYYRNNIKEPINFNDISKVDGISATEFDSLIQENITSKLFGENKIGTTEILLIVIIVGVAVSLFMLWNIQSKGISLSPESLSLLKDSFRSVINGG